MGAGGELEPQKPKVAPKPERILDPTGPPEPPPEEPAEPFAPPAKPPAPGPEGPTPHEID